MIQAVKAILNVVQTVAEKRAKRQFNLNLFKRVELIYKFFKIIKKKLIIFLSLINDLYYHYSYKQYRNFKTNSNYRLKNN